MAMGLTLQIVVQSLINIAVVIGVFPTKGIPLAFISFGGTSLIMSMFIVGVLLNISMNRGADPRPPRR
jgi:cell division protein FtsW